MPLQREQDFEESSYSDSSSVFNCHVGCIYTLHSRVWRQLSTFSRRFMQGGGDDLHPSKPSTFRLAFLLLRSCVIVHETERVVSLT